ncbi:hypothetical protein F5X99DRAFT_40119 [Biscogniauxia marginata]|nr:hypothetical protein F5X99DRAFT_40119 [Biscogniauxia marginata]
MASSRRGQTGPAAEPFDESELRAVLDGISIDGSFAVFEPFRPIGFDIAVKDVGPISSPLSEAQAKQIIAKSRLAPDGEGSETGVDTAVQNTWELDPDQFEIRDRIWQYHLDRILLRAGERLGIIEPIHAELYKMLLYEKGAVEKAHVDTEKIPGMFGTLVISLPSPHEGGDVIVKYHDQTKTFKTSEHEMSYLSWYSDIPHEVLPVKSGYRWVLTYNLAMFPAKNKPESVLDTFIGGERELRRILGSWAEEVRGGQRRASPLCYALQHKYSEENVSLEALKYTDRARANRLQRICSNLRFDLVLATLERVDYGTTEPDYDRYKKYNRYNKYRRDEYEDDSNGNAHHDIDDLLQTTRSVKFVFDLSGRKIASSICIGEGDILQEDPFGDELDDEDYDMSHWRPEATHWYRLSALVMVPPKGAVSFFSKGALRPNNNDFYTTANYFVDRCINWPGYDVALDEFHQTLQHGPSWRTWAFDEDVLQKALQVSVNTPKLFYLFVNRTSQPVPTSFITWLRKEYDASNISLKTLEKIFLSIITFHRKLRLQHQAISAFIGDTGSPDELEDIISRAVDEALTNTNLAGLHEADGLALFDLSLYHKGFDYLKTTVVPIVARCSDSTGFILEFLRALLESIRRRQVPQEEAKSIYEHLALLTLQTLELPSLAIREPPAAQQAKVAETIPTFGVATAVTHFVNYDSFVGFISSLFQFRFMKHMDLFLATIQHEIDLVRGELLNSLWIPFLIDLIRVLERYNATLTAPCWQQFYQSFLTAYLKNCVKDKPVGHSFSRKTVTCYWPDCQDCASLNAFLASAVQEVARFPMSKPRRLHIHEQLDAFRINCTHVTDRNTRPETLVVTKTGPKPQLAINGWIVRRLKAESNLVAFNPEKLRQLLANQYESIMNMEILEPSTRLAHHSQLTQSRAPLLQPTPVNIEQQLAQVDAEIHRLANSSAEPFASGAHRPQPPPPNPQPPTAFQRALELSFAPNARVTKYANSASQQPARRGPAPAGPHGAAAPSRFRGTLSRTPARPAHSGNVSLPANATPRPTAGVKRKISEVIDLTGDDD